MGDYCGTEDPRIVRGNGTFYVTYTAYNIVTPQLVIATSEDLINWKKYPPLFPGCRKSKLEVVSIAPLFPVWSAKGYD
jgi:predicted GH43/DUF377 family glycosyl hydrolase